MFFILRISCFLSFSDLIFLITPLSAESPFCQCLKVSDSFSLANSALPSRFPHTCLLLPPAQPYDPFMPLILPPFTGDGHSCCVLMMATAMQYLEENDVFIAFVLPRPLRQLPCLLPSPQVLEWRILMFHVVLLFSPFVMILCSGYYSPPRKAFLGLRTVCVYEY